MLPPLLELANTGMVEVRESWTGARDAPSSSYFFLMGVLDMHYCELCQKSFKTTQGLLGHQRMVHNVGAAQNNGETEQNSHECRCGAVQHYQHKGGILAPQGSTEVEKRLELIESAMEHLGDKDHQREHELVRKAYDEGFQRGVAGMVDIPGVLAAKGFNDWSQEHEREHPSFPVVHGWDGVPGAKELIAEYQLSKSVIKVVPDSDDFLAGIWRSGVG